MLSTGDQHGSSEEKKIGETLVVPGDNFSSSSIHSPKADKTHRKLKSRHIQLIGIGGTIGTALYVGTFGTPPRPFSPNFETEAAAEVLRGRMGGLVTHIFRVTTQHLLSLLAQLHIYSSG